MSDTKDFKTPFFIKYPSIENMKYKYKVDQDLVQQPIWMVNEKVHGANFQFCMDKYNNLLPGKRSGFIKTDQDMDHFYHCHSLVTRMKPKIELLWSLLNVPDLYQITVFGELFGGSYNGFKANHKPVQKHVLYCPNVDYIAFDILIMTKDHAPYFLSYDDLENFCKQANLLYVKPLFKGGTLEQAYEFSKTIYESNTDIPVDYYQLPNLEKNIREGNVIRANVQRLLGRSDYYLLKHKNDAFCESVHKTKNKKDENDDVMKKSFITNAMDYITNNRLDSVISKEGHDAFYKKHIELQVTLFLEDAISDYKKDNPCLDLTAVQWKEIRFNLRPHAKNMIQQSNQ